MIWVGFPHVSVAKIIARNENDTRPMTQPAKSAQPSIGSNIPR